MNNELIGIISNESELKGVIEDNSFNVKVQITESGPRGLPGPPGTTNYNDLTNKPRIESVELIGDKTFNDFGLLPMTLEEIENLL